MSRDTVVIARTMREGEAWAALGELDPSAVRILVLDPGDVGLHGLRPGRVVFLPHWYDRLDTDQQMYVLDQVEVFKGTVGTTVEYA